MQSRRVWLAERRRSGAGGRGAGVDAPSPSRVAGRVGAGRHGRSPSGPRAAGRRPSWRWPPTGCRSAPTCCGSRRRPSSPATLMVAVRRDAAPFGVYVHVPFCSTRCDYCAFATWTDRPHLDRRLPRRRARATIDAGVDGGMPAGDERVRRRRDADARAGRRPGRGAAGDPAGARRRGHRRVQPRRRHARRCSRRTSPPASTGCRSACSRWCRTCCAVLGRTPRPGQRRAGRRRGARRRAADVQPRPHLRRGRRDAGRLADDAGAGAGPRPAARVGVRARPSRPGTPLADDPARHPDDDVQADEYELADELLTRRRAGQLRGVELGPARPRVPPQPPLLAPARLPRVRLRRPLAPRRAALVEPAHARALHRRGARRPLDRGRRRGARRRDPPVRGPPAVAAHDGRRAASTPSTATTCPASSSGSATAGCSPAAAG